MNIACVTTFDAQNKKSFGGRVYYMLKALENEVDNFEYLGPLKQFKPYSFWFKGLEYYYRYIRRKTYNRYRDRQLIQYFGRTLSRQLHDSKADIIFSPTSPASQPVAYINSDIPIVTWSDSVYASILNYHPEFSLKKVSSKMMRDGLAIERNMFLNSKLNILKTDWAKNSAIKYYDVDPDKILVVPGGPSLEYDIPGEDVEKWIRHRSTEKCRLVFVGGHWEYKGGPIAYEVVKRLNKRGLETELLIVGCEPEIDERDRNMVKVFGHVNKFTRDGFMRFRNIMKDAHFFLLPTRAEAMGISFIEANAFGLPTLGTKTGGVSTVIRDGINGMTFAKDASIDEYSDYIAEIFFDNMRYQKLANSSFNEYKTRLNWDVSAKKVVNAMEQLIEYGKIVIN